VIAVRSSCKEHPPRSAHTAHDDLHDRARATIFTTGHARRSHDRASKHQAGARSPATTWDDGAHDRWIRQRSRRRPRLRTVGSIAESATLAVDARAKALKAAGRPVIGFGAGEPDFPTPDYIVEAAVAACREPRFHRYTPAGGLPELKEAIAAKTARDSGYTVGASQVLVTNGGKQALYNAFATLLDAGDEVLLPTPYWTTYPESIRLAGGVPVDVPTDETSGYLATVDQLEAAVTERTKALVFVSPSNPTGAVYPPEQVEAIGRWALDRGLWVVTDEIYEHLVYGDATFKSMPARVPELAQQCSVVNGWPRPTR
jgi:aspartate/methionine/tyrosine aminotransferase